MTQEIEIKLSTTPEGLARLRRARAFGTAATGNLSRRRLRGIYYDTEDGALASLGVALRMRKEGRRWVQAAKGPAKAMVGALARAECEATAPGGRIDLELITDQGLRAQIEAVAAEAPLAPVYETDFTRARRRAETPEGTQIEICFDEGCARAGGRETPICEIEFELAMGDATALYDLARAAGAMAPCRLGFMTKAERASRLAAGEGDLERAPVKAAAPDFGPASTVELALRDTLRACVRQIGGNVAPLVETDDPEAIHQMRVAVRRLRSALAIFKPVGACPEATRLGAEAKWLADALGPTRSLDVFLDELLTPVEQAFPGDLGLALLRARGEAALEPAREAAREAVASPRAFDLIIDLAAFTERQGWRRLGDLAQTPALAAPAAKFAASALRKRFRAAKKYGVRIASLDVPERHELRLRLKKLRYSVGFFDKLYSKKQVQAYEKRLKALQEIFGYLNDAAEVERLVDELLANVAESEAPALARAAGTVIGWHAQASERAWEDAKQSWTAFAKAKPFWRHAG